MEIEITRIGFMDRAATVASMAHRGKQIQWDVSIIEKTSYKTGDYEVFAEINGYWAKCSRETQDQIFDVYTRIRNLFGEVHDNKRLTHELRKLVAELLRLHNHDDMDHFLRFHANVRIPDGLRESFKESHETPGTRERTYLRDDYWELMILSATLRCMTPVWGEYIARTEAVMGATWKEFNALQLLNGSHLISTPAWEKLSIFVQHSLPTDKSIASAIIERVSSEDFPEWILALVVIRRLTIADLRGINPQASIVTFIYRYIGQKARGHDTNFAGQVKEKIVDTQGDEGSSNNLSRMENNKNKADLPQGDISVVRYDVADPYKLARRSIPDIEDRVLEISLKSTASRLQGIPRKPQITLARWVLKTAGVSPRSVDYLRKPSLVRCLGVAQALLWIRGYKELAALVAATPRPSRTMRIGSSFRERITKEQAEELLRLIPHTRRTGSRSKNAKVQPCEALKDIDTLDKQFSEYDWQLTLPAAWVKELTGADDRYYVVPGNIKVELAKLAIAVASRNF